MNIWGKVCKTDSEFTKKVNQRGGYTAIDATYQALKATELFGAYGTGWGLKTVNYDFSLFEQTKMAVCHAVFFYIIDGKEFVEMNSDRMLMGGNLDWSNPYETVEFDSVDDPGFINWLETNNWIDELDAINSNLGKIQNPQS